MSKKNKGGKTPSAKAARNLEALKKAKEAAIAAAASTTGTALGTIQGSCRPLISSISSFMLLRLMLFCAFEMEGVGLIAV